MKTIFALIVLISQTAFAAETIHCLGHSKFTNDHPMPVTILSETGRTPDYIQIRDDWNGSTEFTYSSTNPRMNGRNTYILKGKRTRDWGMDHMATLEVDGEGWNGTLKVGDEMTPNRIGKFMAYTLICQ